MLAWANLLVPLVLAVAAVIVTVVRRIRRGRADPAAAGADAGTPAREPVLTTTRQETR